MFFCLPAGGEHRIDILVGLSTVVELVLAEEGFGTRSPARHELHWSDIARIAPRNVAMQADRLKPQLQQLRGHCPPIPLPVMVGMYPADADHTLQMLRAEPVQALVSDYCAGGAPLQCEEEPVQSPSCSIVGGGAHCASTSRTTRRRKYPR